MTQCENADGGCACYVRGESPGSKGAHVCGEGHREATLPSIPNEATDPFVALGVENITRRVREAGVAASSAFAGDPTYEAFFDSLSRALHRHQPAHVLLVRERGVGEQAVIIELASRALAAHPPFLRGKQVLAADCRRIAPEEVRPRIDALFAAVGERDDLILCVDGFASLLRPQGPFDNQIGLLARLAQCRCRVIGVLTPQEYEEFFAADAECHELFAALQLPEPDEPVAVRLVRHFADGLQRQYGLVIDDAAVRQAVVLSARYVLHERLPLKAVKLLRSICDDLCYEQSELGRTPLPVGEEGVVRKVSQATGIPAETLAGVGERLDYAKSLAESVVGQDHAVREVATELGLIKAGLAEAGKPASVMLFIGQTGTGKTELAKTLARLYSPSKRLKTFTLGNFSEPHSVSGIIGVPPGYVGHDQGGRLVNELNADPHSVFLLDEADKAHPDVMQPFLNLFDEGWIYDQRGVKAYADRAIFVLTTNVGQRQIADLCKQGKSIDEITATMKESLSRIRHTKSNRPVFTPEFLARIKRVIMFRSLDAAAMLGITRKLAGDLARDWQAKRQKTLNVADELLVAIAHKAHAMDEKSQGKEGGRIVRKLIADLIESRIQIAISERPDDYRAADTVCVRFSPPPVSQITDMSAEAWTVAGEQVTVAFGEAVGPARS